MRLRHRANGLAAPLVSEPAQPRIPRMAAAFITCAAPRSMTTEHATAWLERRARTLRAADQVEEVTVRELRPRGRDSVWLLHVVLRADENDDWNRLLGELVTDLRRLGMRPIAVVDERSKDVTTGQAEVEHVA